jgi:hypothetical protein
MHFKEKPRFSPQNSRTEKMRLLIFAGARRFACGDLTRLAISVPTIKILMILLPPGYYSDMARKATGLLPDLSQTRIWLNICYRNA